MAKFEKVSRFKDIDLNLPERKTAKSAGYDFEVAEDIEIPAYADLCEAVIIGNIYDGPGITEILLHPEHIQTAFTLEQVSDITKKYKCKPTLVPTGIKCQLADDEYLELSVRSSCPLKYWLVLGNSVGIIDADYYNNPDNEGEIFFQMINLFPYPIKLRKGDRIGQGIIHKYGIVEDDKACGERLGGYGSTGV